MTLVQKKALAATYQGVLKRQIMQHVYVFMILHKHACEESACVQTKMGLEQIDSVQMAEIKYVSIVQKGSAEGQTSQVSSLVQPLARPRARFLETGAQIPRHRKRARALFSRFGVVRLHSLVVQAGRSLPPAHPIVCHSRAKLEPGWPSKHCYLARIRSKHLRVSDHG